VSPEALGTALLAGAAWTATAVVGHVAVFRLARVEHRARTLVLCFACAAFATLWTCLLLDVDRWRTLYGMVVVGCAFVLYMPFYYTIAASQSVQLVIAIHAAPEGLSLEEIRQRYPATGVLAGRFETLVWAGYVTETSGRFALTAKGRLVSRPFRAVKWIWRLGPGG
jgi:Ca2+/Na+ antiporter